jgi:glycolate oxidase FAD binding subunit
MIPSPALPSDEILRRLGDTCGPDFARAAGAGDAIAEIPARWVGAPGTVAGMAEALRVAADYQLAVVTRGAGTKMDWGAAPSHVDLVLDAGRLAGVWRHSVEGLVAEVGAGTPLRAVQARLAQAGQRLALDPPSTDATVGGVIATDEAGPLRHRFGTPREQLLAVTYVRADGTVTNSSGRNAHTSTGQDMGKLLCGSYGALGVLVSATFQVHPRPISRAWVSRSVWTPLEVHDLVGELLSGPLAPAAVEVDLPAGAPTLLPRQRGVQGLRGPGTLTVLIEGAPWRVAARAAEAAGVLGGDATVAEVPPPWWGRYPFDPGDVALKLAVPISDLHAAVYALRDAAGALVPVRGSAGVGVVHAALPGDAEPGRVAAVLDAVRGVLLARGGSCVVLTAPAEVREAIDMWGDLPGVALLRQLKQRFDPDRRLAPGRFLGGL